MNKWTLATVGVVCVTIIEIIALLKGINGVYLSACIGAILALIGGVAGFNMGMRHNLTAYINEVINAKTKDK